MITSYLQNRHTGGGVRREAVIEFDADLDVHVWEDEDGTRVIQLVNPKTGKTQSAWLIDQKHVPELFKSLNRNYLD